MLQVSPTPAYLGSHSHFNLYSDSTATLYNIALYCTPVFTIIHTVSSINGSSAARQFHSALSDKRSLNTAVDDGLKIFHSTEQIVAAAVQIQHTLSFSGCMRIFININMDQCWQSVPVPRIIDLV